MNTILLPSPLRVYVMVCYVMGQNIYWPWGQKGVFEMKSLICAVMYSTKLYIGLKNFVLWIYLSFFRTFVHNLNFRVSWNQKKNINQWFDRNRLQRFQVFLDHQRPNKTFLSSSVKINQKEAMWFLKILNFSIWTLPISFKF